MQSKSEDSSSVPLAVALERTLSSDLERGPSIGSLTAGVGEKGFGLLLMVLSLPSALPVPAPGYSTPFGIVISFLALQMIAGRSNIWIPSRFSRIHIKPDLAKKMIGVASSFLRKIERFIRPRQNWMATRIGQTSLALVVILMASLMVLPIPLTNTFPAMVIFFIGISLSEDDGLIALFALGVGVFALLIYVGIIYILITQGPEAINALKDTIKSLLGLS